MKIWKLVAKLTVLSVAVGLISAASTAAPASAKVSATDGDAVCKAVTQAGDVKYIIIESSYAATLFDIEGKTCNGFLISDPYPGETAYPRFSWNEKCGKPSSEIDCSKHQALEEADLTNSPTGCTTYLPAARGLVVFCLIDG